MENNTSKIKYKHTIFSRYFILKEGLFKNTKKLLNIYKDSIIIENIDESEREIIIFEDIVNVEYVDGNPKEFTISYKSKGLENSITFSSVYRTQVVCDLLRQIDLYSKINKHPVETFKCFMFFDPSQNFQYYLESSQGQDASLRKDSFKLEKDQVISNNNSPNVKPITRFDTTLNIYRSILELVPLDSKREIRLRFSDIDNIKIYDNSIIQFETYNKIDIYIVAKNTKNSNNLKLIIEKFSENCRTFLGYEVNIEHISSKDILATNKTQTVPKSKLFVFQKIHRILYNNQWMEFSLWADYDFLYEIYENSENAITKLTKIPISEISYLIMYENEKQFFEVVMKNNARFLYQAINNERDLIVTHLIDLISNKDESNFLLLPSKPKFGMRINGFINDQVDWEYEKQLLNNLYSFFSDPVTREQIVEDICLNFCFKSDKFKMEPITNKKIYQMIYELIPEELNNLENFLKNEEKEKKLNNSQNQKLKSNNSTSAGNTGNKNQNSFLFTKVYTINNYLILCKNIFVKSHYDKLISDVINYVENSLNYTNLNFNFQTIFYNAISIFKNLIPPKNGILKKDEIAQRKWMISSHFDNAIKIKKFLFSKIFNINYAPVSTSLSHPQNTAIGSAINYHIYANFPALITTNKQKIENFESINALSIYILMELQKNIYEFSHKETNLMGDIVKEFNQFDFLYILYILMRCYSNIMKQISISMLINLIKNLSIHEEYSLKNLILTRTLIFLVLLNIYIKSPNDITNILALKFLKSFVISHVEATTLMLNIFPMTLFYYIDKKPNPINWLDHEWDNFFKAILRDHNTTGLIWNQLCRNELYDYINKIIERYEYFTEDNSMVLAFHLENDEKEKEIPSYNLYKTLAKDDGVSNYLNLNSNTTPLTSQNERDMREYSPNPILKTHINTSFYCFNYKEIKMEYQTLKKHVFVWQYYLKRIINENGRPNLSHHIEKPKKFWKKLMNEIIVSSNENKILLIIKTLILLYKFYYELIGVFKEYDYMLRLFNNTDSVDIKIIIIQMFLVTVEMEEKEIKEPNLKNLIELKAPEYFINFIPNLITNDYLKDSIEKSFTIEKINFSIENSNKPSYSFLDNKSLFIKNLVPDDLNFDKKFANYTNYVHIDDSWFTADKNIKATTLIIRLFKLLMKRFSIIDEKLQKINFPLPKIKNICYDTSNYNKIISLLFSENENLVIETLDLILNFMNDPLNYKNNAYNTNLVDILVFYMIKYKSKSIMKFLENLYYYHNIFYDFDFLIKNSLLNEDEIEFFNQYPNANKFLIRYFPNNLIYYYMTTDFIEFTKILFEKNERPDLIWSKEMLTYLIFKLRESFLNIFSLKTQQGSPSSTSSIIKLFLDENFKINYPNMQNKLFCFIYYLDLYISNKTRIDNSHVNIFSRCLLLKLKKKYEELNEKFSKKSINTININNNESHQQIQSQFYDEDLMIYLMSLNNLIKCHNLVLGEFANLVTEIYNKIILKENLISEKEHRVLSIILNSLYISISNTKNDEPLHNAFGMFGLLIKSFKFFTREYFTEKSKESKLEIINILKSLIELIQKQPKILDNLDKSSSLEKAYEYLHKILYSEFVIFIENKKNLEFDADVNIEIIDLIIDLTYEYSKNFNSSMHLIEHGLVLEIILLILKFRIKPKCKNQEIVNKFSIKAFIILKNIIDHAQGTENKEFDSKSLILCKNILDVLNKIFDKQLFIEFTFKFENEEFDIYDNYYSKSSKVVNDKLVKLKSNFENPEFIWNKNLRKEIKKLILDVLKKLSITDYTEKNTYNNELASDITEIIEGESPRVPDFISEIKNFKYKSCEQELKVGNIYVKIYNNDPSWRLSNSAKFLENSKDMIMSYSLTENFQNENVSEILNGISNALNGNYSDINDINILINDEKFISTFYKLLKNCISNVKHSEKEKILNSGLNLIHTFSSKQNSLKLVLDSHTFYILIQVIENYKDRELLEPIIKILRNVLKFTEFAEKINLSIFLFLLKKVIFLKDSITKSSKDVINSLRLEILKIIKKFIFNEKVGFAIKGLYEFYLPLKIIDNLFSGKEVLEINLTWIDTELELPDLIWNHDAMNQSKRLLEEDCNFILNDENNLENFPHNLLTHKLDPHKIFFFEISDEFRIDNIYLRVFNKDPSYNIGKNLIIFLKHVLNSAMSTLKYYTTLNFYFFLNSEKQEIIRSKFENNSNSQPLNKVYETVRHKLLTCLSAICLIIEQINFNDFNDNLGISSAEEMKNVIKDEQEKNLLALVQRSFDFSKLLSIKLITKITSLSKFILGLDEKIENNFIKFDNSIRLVYLQIIYLMTLNKHGINYISENFDVVGLMDKMYLNHEKIGDCKKIIK
jgi:hypothetical protein